MKERSTDPPIDRSIDRQIIVCVIYKRRNPKARTVRGRKTRSQQYHQEERKVMQTISHLPAGDQWRDWPSMTEPLLLDILRRLDTLEDFSSFRRVCEFWRAVAAPNAESLASQHPLLLLPTSLSPYAAAYYDAFRGRLYAEVTLDTAAAAACRPMAYAYGHLVGAVDHVDGSQQGTKLALWNIFDEAPELPRICLPAVPDRRFDRVLLSSHPSSPGCRVLLYSKKETAVVLQHLQIGEPSWKVVHLPQLRISDMIFFKNKLYALSPDMQLLAIDHHHLEGEGLEHEHLLGSADDQASSLDPEKYDSMWLAVSGGGDELLAICKTSFTWVGMRFHVFSWDFGKNVWEEMRSLGGRALFMDVQGSAGSVEPSNEMGIAGNCIYYLGYENDRMYKFCLEDQSLMAVPIYRPGKLGESRHSTTALPPVWVLPSIC